MNFEDSIKLEIKSLKEQDNISQSLIYILEQIVSNIVVLETRVKELKEKDGIN